MLQNKAMLANLSISRWTAQRIDSKVTREVTQAHNATSDSGDFRKTLVDRAHLKQLTASASALRAFHNKLTLPWDDNSDRILPSALYQEYTSGIKHMRLADEKLRKDFVALYPQLLAAAPKRLGTLYNPKDFPTIAQIADKFDIRISLKPIPSADDFRVNVGDEATALIREQLTAENDAKFQAAMRECYTRVQDVVGHISTTLRKEDPRIFDTLITNARDLVACLPALNLTGDPILEELRQELDAMLPSPNALRANAQTRTKTADAADAILAKMKAYQ